MIDEKYVMFSVVNLTHYSDDMIISPTINIAGGELDIIFCNDKISRIRMVNIFLELSKAGQLSYPEWNMYKTNEVIYETDEEQYFTTSGEKIPSARKVHIKVHKGAMSLL